MAENSFCRVNNNLDNAPLQDHLLHGYEYRQDFQLALQQLIDRWHDRIGEQIDERSGFIRLRFYDTPGGLPDEAWLPTYLLTPIAQAPRGQNAQSPRGPNDSLENEINLAFGFD